MTKMIFLNFPVRDLSASIAFYNALGGTQNQDFSDERTACMMFSDAIGVMLLTHERYAEFTTRPIGDARAQSQALIAISEESRGDVDTRLTACIGAGGTADPNPSQDYGFMYSRSVEDPDGNVWEVMWMDPAAAGGDAPAS